MRRRMLWLVLALVTLTGCSDLSIKDQYLDIFSTSSAPAQGEAQEMEPITELRVPVDINDSLNPYKAAGETNLALMPLLYDPLFKLDEQWQAQPWLAQSAAMNGEQCTVTLRAGVTFSNGAPVTGADVAASYQRAADMPARYPQLAAQVTDCTAAGNTVTFTLLRADKNFPALLNFPILPAGAGEEDGVPGTGRYRFADGQRRTLVQNTGHWGGGGPVETIHLVEIPDRESLSYSLKTGVVDLLFSDLSDPDFYNVSSAGQMVPLSNLVFLGVNQETELLGLASFRQALEPYLNRERMAGKVYSNRAEAALSPFPPAYYDLPDQLPRPQRTADEQKMTLDSLTQAELDGAGYRVFDGERVSFRLVFCNENPYRQPLAEELAEELRACGVELILVPLSYADYQRALAAGEYDLFLGEVKLGDNLDLTPLLSTASLGVEKGVFDLNLVNLYREYQAGTADCAAFLRAFYASQPIYPLLYRRGIAAYSGTFSAQVTATAQDIFYNIAGW